MRSVSSPTGMVGVGPATGSEGSRDHGGGGAKAGAGNSVNREQVMERETLYLVIFN